MTKSSEVLRLAAERSINNDFPGSSQDMRAMFILCAYEEDKPLKYIIFYGLDTDLTSLCLAAAIAESEGD